ncbi:MAG: hypothetical protein HC814_06895, partial [Rhodobacteraceae bacterium]|nr:hypothetical protein [Paracoccaceae bacterium]
MTRYVLSRLATAFVLVLLSTLVVFLIANAVPGDPALAALGEEQASDPAAVKAFRALYGLDLPVWQQYWLFLRRLAEGDFGRSIASRREIINDIIDYAPATIELATIAFVLSLVLGLPLGILAAVRAGVASIEHGSTLTPEILQEMKQRGTYLVPTTYLADAIDLEALHPILRAKAEKIL